MVVDFRFSGFLKNLVNLFLFVVAAVAVACCFACCLFLFLWMFLFLLLLLFLLMLMLMFVGCCCCCCLKGLLLFSALSGLLFSFVQRICVRVAFVLCCVCDCSVLVWRVLLLIAFVALFAFAALLCGSYLDVFSVLFCVVFGSDVASSSIGFTDDCPIFFVA